MRWKTLVATALTTLCLLTATISLSNAARAADPQPVAAEKKSPGTAVANSKAPAKQAPSDDDLSVGEARGRTRNSVCEGWSPPSCPPGCKDDTARHGCLEKSVP